MQEAGSVPMMTSGEWKQATRLSASDWPDPHTFIVELRDALGMFSGAMHISPKQAWEDALTEVRRLRDVAEAEGAA